MPVKESKRRIVIERKSRKGETNNVSIFVQVKNSSRKDSMTEVEFAYEDSAGKKNHLRMADDLSPQKVARVDFAKLGLSIQVLSFAIAWQFQSVEYGSQVHTAKAGAYFYSMELALKPDGSSESSFFVEKPLSVS